MRRNILISKFKDSIDDKNLPDLIFSIKIKLFHFEIHTYKIFN